MCNRRVVGRDIAPLVHAGLALCGGRRVRCREHGRKGRGHEQHCNDRNHPLPLRRQHSTLDGRGLRVGTQAAGDAGRVAVVGRVQLQLGFPLTA